MTTRNTSRTRRIWTKANGKIPKDDLGRSFEIHHLDGDPSNDSLHNLVCVSIDEHYRIHESQGDWMACHRISIRMNKTSEEISHLSTLAQRKRVEDGTHNFLGGALQRKLVEDGTHPLLTGEIQSYGNKKRWADGTHVLIGYNEKRITNGTHNWLGPEQNDRKIADGTHVFVREWKCEHCGKSGKNLGLFSRWGHNDGSCLGERTFLPSTTDHTVYFWKNKNTGEIVHMTRYQICKAYGIRSQDVYHVISKRRKSTHGWTLVDSV